MNSRYLRIQGKGLISQSPDRIHIYFSMTGKDGEFTKAVENCNTACEAVRAAAKSCGINPDELTTSHFSVGAETKYVSGKHRHVGFESMHELMIVLPIEKGLIGRFLSAVVSAKANPQVSLKFDVSDPEALKQKVLIAAIENAKRSAETIALAAGIKLGSISNIEYGCAVARASSRSLNMACAPSVSGDISPDFEPEDLRAEDGVTVTWKIVS